MNKKKWFFVVLFSFLMVAVVAFVLYSNREWKLEREGIGKSSLKDILFYEVGREHQDSMCLITTKDNRGEAASGVVPGKYISFWNAVNKEYYNEKTGMTRLVTLVDQEQPYNVVTKEFEPVIDVKKLWQEHTPLGYEGYQGDTYVLEKDKKYYLFRRIIKDEYIETEGLDEEWGMYVNIETGGVLLEPWDSQFVFGYSPSESKVDALLVQEGILLELLLESNGFTYDEAGEFAQGTRGVTIDYTTFEGTLQITTEPQTLPKESEKLYREFPELKTYQGGEDELVTLYLSGYPKAEAMMKMLLGDGREISFDGCVLSAEDSKDGAEHKIGSFEEYYQWVKESFALPE